MNKGRRAGTLPAGITSDPNNVVQPSSGRSILRETPHGQKKKGKCPHTKSAEEDEEGDKETKGDGASVDLEITGKALCRLHYLKILSNQSFPKV